MLQTAAAQPFGHVTIFVPVRLRLEMPRACESGQRRRTLRASVDPTEAREATVRRFGRSDRSALCKSEGGSYYPSSATASWAAGGPAGAASWRRLLAAGFGEWNDLA